MLPPLYDLFGEVVVTRDDVETWLDVVPGFSRTCQAHRRDNYARSWNVPAKIRAAKLAGTWTEIVAQRRAQLAAVGA